MPCAQYTIGGVREKNRCGRSRRDIISWLFAVVDLLGAAEIDVK